MTRDHVTLFLDTNTLLHFPPIKEVKWCSVCNAKSVTLIMCHPVMKEIDEKKYDSMLSDRAKSVEKEFKAIKKNGGQVRESVQLEILNKYLRKEDFLESKVPDNRDEQILYLAFQCQTENKDTKVIVYSNDWTFQQRCEAAGIEWIAPDEDTIRDLPKTELEKKYKKAVTELNELKNSKPILEVLLGNEDGSYEKDKIIEYTINTQYEILDVEGVVKKERETLESYVTHLKKRAGRGNSFYGDSGEYSNVGVELYAEKIPQYIERFREWVEKVNKYKAICTRKCAFSIIINNNGNAPAENIDLHLKFPPILDGIHWGEKEHIGIYPFPPSKPRQPKEPRTRMQQLADNLTFIAPRLHDNDISEDEFIESPIEFNCYTANGFTISYHTESIKHYHRKYVGPLYLVFKEGIAISPFQLECWATAGNLQDRYNKTLNFIVAVDEEAQDEKPDEPLQGKT
ncbi:MAG: hypothetical protein E3J72_14300 [Planctomycetota bacterium]|nr:MAG: hypothetical protein E3J72_14300 [Planctomycetota bacterium]